MMGDSRGFQERVQDGIILKEEKIRRVQVMGVKRPVAGGPKRYDQANVGEYLYQKAQHSQARKEQ